MRERFADPDGRIRATFDIVWLSGWAPHESQQKPLQPGSAKASLEEAVKGARPNLSSLRGLTRHPCLASLKPWIAALSANIARAHCASSE